MKIYDVGQVTTNNYSFGFANASIKSIQTIETTYAQTNKTITINAVDTSKSVVVVELGDSSGTGVAEQVIPVGVLSNVTTVTLSSNGASAYTLSVKVTVIEFQNVKSVQSGNIAISSASPNNVTINSVNPAKCLVFARVTGPTGSTMITLDECYGIVTTATNLKLVQNTGWGTASRTVYWQVIEFL